METDSQPILCYLRNPDEPIYFKYQVVNHVTKQINKLSLVHYLKDDKMNTFRLKYIEQYLLIIQHFKIDFLNRAAGETLFSNIQEIIEYFRPVILSIESHIFNKKTNNDDYADKMKKLSILLQSGSIKKIINFAEKCSNKTFNSPESSPKTNGVKFKTSKDPYGNTIINIENALLKRNVEYILNEETCDLIPLKKRKLTNDEEIMKENEETEDKHNILSILPREILYMIFENIVTYDYKVREEYIKKHMSKKYEYNGFKKLGKYTIRKDVINSSLTCKLFFEIIKDLKIKKRDEYYKIIFELSQFRRSHNSKFLESKISLMPFGDLSLNIFDVKNIFNDQNNTLKEMVHCGFIDVNNYHVCSKSALNHNCGEHKCIKNSGVETVKKMTEEEIKFQEEFYRKVEEIDITDLKMKKTDEFGQFLKSYQKLKTVALKENEQSVGNIVLLQNKGVKKIMVDCCNKKINKNFLKFAKVNLENLKLSNNIVSEHNVIIKLTLSKVTVSNLSELDFLQHLKNLEYFKMSNTLIKFNDTAAPNYAEKTDKMILSNLKVLKILCVSDHVSSYIKSSFQIPNLKKMKTDNDLLVTNMFIPENINIQGTKYLRKNNLMNNVMPNKYRINFEKLDECRRNHLRLSIRRLRCLSEDCFSNLKSLSLKYLHFKCSEFKTFIMRFKLLEKLNLSYNYLSINDDNDLELGNHPQLRIIKLKGNELCYSSVSKILEQCPKLKKLDVRHCYGIKLTSSYKYKRDFPTVEIIID